MRQVQKEDFEYGRRCAFCGKYRPKNGEDIAIQSYREGFENDLNEVVICESCHGKLFFEKEEAEVVNR